MQTGHFRVNSRSLFHPADLSFMNILAVILARAGSKGLPDKCVLPLCGRPVLAYTISHAQQSRLVTDVVLTTDSPEAASVAQTGGIQVIERPGELASDQAPVDAAVRHAVERWEKEADRQADAVVILYGNVPVRADGIIDKCLSRLVQTGCDSVRTLAQVSKQHPDWLHRVEGNRMEQYRQNSIHRRQDLEPLYYHDGAVVVVTRNSLFHASTAADPHAFFGSDCRSVIQQEEDTVDIDTPADFYRAEAIIRANNEAVFFDPPSAGSRKPPFTAAVSACQR
jgi:N-acylneuraminate cytidylyltransferase